MIGMHARLIPADECYFIYEYTSHKRYDYSSTNQLIFNLKKRPTDLHKRGQRYYKDQAISRCADALRQVINDQWLKTATLVPVPCSKAVTNPDFDDRIERICRMIRPGTDVRPLVRQTASTVASHEVAPGQRPSVDDLLAVYKIDEAKAFPPPTAIAVIDDVLTVGTHFRAMEKRLSDRFPGVPIVAFFIARRVFPDDEVLDWADL